MKGLTIALIIIGVMSAFVVGAAVGFKAGFNPADILSGAQGGSYQDGFNHARDLLAKSGLFPSSTVKIASLTGTVKSVDAKGLVITVNDRVVMNPLDPQGPAERRIEVSDDTAIFAMIALTQEEMSEENNKLQQAIKDGKPILPFQMFKEEKRVLSDIKPGMTVTVSADDDVSVALTIKAKKISLNMGGAVETGLPAPPPPVSSPSENNPAPPSIPPEK